jgi:hypothetical protein
MLVDIQYDFLPPNGSLAVPDGADILPTVYDLLDHSHFDAYFASQVGQIHVVETALARLSSRRYFRTTIRGTMSHLLRHILGQSLTRWFRCQH